MLILTACRWSQMTNSLTVTESRVEPVPKSAKSAQLCYNTIVLCSCNVNAGVTLRSTSLMTKHALVQRRAHWAMLRLRLSRGCCTDAVVSMPQDNSISHLDRRHLACRSR